MFDKLFADNFQLRLLLLIVLIKLLLFAIDSSPMFYMGDSGAYIATAVDGYMPLDRSILYGLIIRFTALPAHSLSSLLILQVLGSVISIMCLAWILERHFKVRRWLVVLIAVLACIEPLQFMMEHYVMTETLALSSFAVFFALLMSYLFRPGLDKLVYMQLAGIVVISFRIPYMPILLVFTLLAPLLAGFSQRRSAGFSSKRFGLHLLLSIAVFCSLHSGYKAVMGQIHHQPPAYQYADGLFLLAAMSPLLTAEDFPDPAFGSRLLQGLDLSKLYDRETQRWRKGYLIDRLQQEIPNPLEANRIAKEAAFNIIKRDPLGPFRLGFRTWQGFWDLSRVRGQMIADRSTRPLPEYFLQLLEQKFALHADGLPNLTTLSNTIWFHATYWYVFVVSLPLIMLLWIPLRINHPVKVFAIWVIACGLVAAATIPVTLVSIRYLMPLGWLGLLSIGLYLHQLLPGGLPQKAIAAPSEG